MILIILLFLSLYLFKYYLYKSSKERKPAEIFDILLNIFLVLFYILFSYIFMAVYGIETLKTKLAFLLAGISVLLLIAKYFVLKKKKFKYIVIIDILYLIILVLFILTG